MSDNNEQEIRHLLEQWQTALTSGDTETLAKLYMPEVLVYDMKMPHVHRGSAAYKKMWDDCLVYFESPTKYEVKNLEITMGNDVAFSHCFARFSGKLKNGPEAGAWIRATIGYRKMDGVWKIAHEHVSVPVNMESMTPVMDLLPE